MKRLFALALIIASACGLVATITLVSSSSPRSHLPPLKADLAWKDLAPHIEVALAHSNRAAEAQISADFDRWLAEQMAKADAKGGFLEVRMNYWSERLAAIQWGWKWLVSFGDKEAADRSHQQSIARDFASLVISPEQVDQDFRSLSQRKVKYFVSALVAQLDAMRSESGAAAEFFNARLASLELLPGQPSAAALTLASMAQPNARELALSRLYEVQNDAWVRGELSMKVDDAIRVVIGAAVAGSSLAAALKGLGVSSKASLGTGYLAAAVVIVAGAYDSFEHHRTYDARRKHLRQEIEAGLRAFGKDLLKARASGIVEAATDRATSQALAQAI
jgi:hypothetical protein